MQTRTQSLTESITNTASGYLVAVLAQLLIFPLFDVDVSIGDNFMIAGMFTFISIVRNYAIRRLFNNSNNKGTE